MPRLESILFAAIEFIVTGAAIFGLALLGINILDFLGG